MRTVLDLRQAAARERDTGARPDWLTTGHVDLDNLTNAAFWADYHDLDGTALYFLPHLRAMPDRIGAALQAVADAPPGAVLFHCMGGRDRTGLLAMVLLAAAAVEPADIVDDYLETVRVRNAQAAAEHSHSAEPMLDRLCRARGHSTESAFRAALDGLDVDEVLRRAGLDDATITAVRTWRGRLPG